MYEAFFGLRRRPFSPLPRVDSFVPLAPFREPLSDLVRCIEQDQGIGVLTGPAGSGKSLLCRMLYQHFSELQRTVLLTTGRFPTRRALLQAILFELKHPFVGLSEQEARLTILDMLEASPPPSDRLLLIVDEAHLLSPRGLEELRTLSDYEAGERRRVSLVLAGQLELEELLTGASLNALNQRVGCHVCLESLTLEESYQYIRDRLAMAGSNGLLALTPEAMHLIATASEGNPRRLNQLCDHSLLLGYAEEQRPVDVSTVRSALLDLRELPLHWNTPIDLSEPRERNPLEAVARESRLQLDDEDETEVESTWNNNQMDLDRGGEPTLPANNGPENPTEFAESKSDEPTAFVYEVGATTEESPFDQLFQVRKFVVPVALRDPESDPIQSLMADDSHREFEAAAPSNPHMSERPPSMDRDEMMSDSTCPDVSVAAAPMEVFETGLAPQHTSLDNQAACGFDELIIDDNYALIDRLMEKPIDTSIACRPNWAVTTVHSAVEEADGESSNSIEYTTIESIGDDGTSHVDECESVLAPSVEEVDEIPVVERQPVLMESQILELIQEIDADVRSFRRENQTRERPVTASEDSSPTATATDTSLRYSLRQTLNWHFDVVEPEHSCDVQADEHHFESHRPTGPLGLHQAVPTSDTPRQVEYEAPGVSEVPPVAENSALPAQQPTERRYAQLFTRLQRQRRRVESVMNKERRTGSDTHFS